MRCKDGMPKGISMQTARDASEGKYINPHTCIFY